MSSSRALRPAAARRSRQGADARVREMLDAIPGLAVLLDRSGRIVQVNRRWLQAARRHPGARNGLGVGVNYLDVCRRAAEDDDREAAVVHAGLRRVLSGRARHFQANYACRGLRDLWFAMSAMATPGLGGVVVTHVDITTQRAPDLAARGSRIRLAAASRLLTTREVSAALIHDLRQPLTAIAINGGLAHHWLAERADVPAPVRDAASDVLRQTERAAKILDSLPGVYGQYQLQVAALDVPVVVRKVVRALEYEALERHTTVSVSVDRTLPRVRASETALIQALLNVMSNSLEALPEVPAGSRRIEITAAAAGDTAVELRIRDTGPGLRDDVARRAFEPFFSTRPEGMGMGLAVSRSMLTAHGGQIRLARSRGSGAEVVIMLPVDKQPDQRRRLNDRARARARK